MGPLVLIFLGAIFHCKLSHRVSGEKNYKSEDNIGTVLFERSDCGKHCWSTEEFVILNSRRMFQDILPKVNVINSENDQYIAILMDYFHICLECVRKLSIGKTKHLMLKALADTMGGYLKVYILPLTKHSYYAGNIKYRNAKRLFELFEELKKFLHTNGDGWRRASIVGLNRINTPTILVTPSKSPMACNGLVTYPSPVNEKNIKNYRGYDYGRMKRLRKRREKSMRETAMVKRERAKADNDGIDIDSGAVIVPLPFLDDEVQPNSIALPFKKDNLQSLDSEKSAFALVKYYVASVKCIGSKSRTKVQLSKYNRDLYEWLKQKVRPHLEDDKWYPAFGGVLRVMASLKESGFASDTNKPKSGSGEYQVMPKFITETVDGNRASDSSLPPLYKNHGDENGALSFGTTELVVIALTGGLLVWFFIGFSLVCYRFLSRYSEECGPCDSQSSLPYEKGDYCTADVCPSKISHRSKKEKLKEWWKNRFGGCSGGCDRFEDEERCLATMSYQSKDSLNRSHKSIRKRQYNKSVSPLEGSQSLRKVCYTSDDLSTSSERQTKSR